MHGSILSVTTPLVTPGVWNFSRGLVPGLEVKQVQIPTRTKPYGVTQWLEPRGVLCEQICRMNGWRDRSKLKSLF